MGTFKIEDDTEGVKLITFDGELSNDQFEAYLAAMGRMLERRAVYATILDARNAGMTPPVQRKRQANWLKENEAALVRYSAGTAFVITSPIVRGALTAILWLQPLPAPHSVVATLGEARAWTRQRLVAKQRLFDSASAK